MDTRLTFTAAQRLRRAIRDANGVEVFAIGDFDDGKISNVMITCRGQEDRVTALLDRPKAGQVVIHNHPSGNLSASDADMKLAALYGDEGVGVLIVNNDASDGNWVVEPYQRPVVAVDPSQVEAFFRESLPRVMPDVEIRESQIEMALRVCKSLNDNQPLVCEAGTGTGKSLAYLVPAAIWAISNQRKVVISTYTRALQTQLCQSDLPLLLQAGIKISFSQLQGRANYVCKRRLALAGVHADPGDIADVEALNEWQEHQETANRGDLPFSVSSGLWERVESDSDLTLRVRCPHYQSCHYYTARRRAAASELIVVNHALLLTDLHLRSEIGSGLLPKYARIVLDEGHHLEQAATSVSGAQATARSLRRSVSPLLNSKRRKGSLERIRKNVGDSNPKLVAALNAVEEQSSIVHRSAPVWFADVASIALGPDGAPQRIHESWAKTFAYRHQYVPAVERIAALSQKAAEAIDFLETLLEDHERPEGDEQPYLDLRKCRRRLANHAAMMRNMVIDDQLEMNDSHVVIDDHVQLEQGPGDDPYCRWVELSNNAKTQHTAALIYAEVDVADTIRKLLWRPFPGTVVTSATLTVAGRFQFWRRRNGLDFGEDADYPSPFDHSKQAILALPRDQPPPNHPDFMSASEKQVIELVRASDGGAFVLCTSYEAVRHYAEKLRQAGVPGPVLAQGESGKLQLLQRFQSGYRAVLVATDSFWEGISVKGDQLRLVIIPRLPFRVPTDPLRQARHERLDRQGIDAFKAYSLPEAVIKLRQGYGRLIRSTTDRGVVAILDRRVHDRAYGAILLRSLPPAQRAVGPWRAVFPRVDTFFNPKGRTGS